MSLHLKSTVALGTCMNVLGVQVWWSDLWSRYGAGTAEPWSGTWSSGPFPLKILLECFKNHVLCLGKLWQNSKAQKCVDIAWCLVW